MSKIVSKILPIIFGKGFFFIIFASLLSLQVSPASAALSGRQGAPRPCQPVPAPVQVPEVSKFE